MHVQQKCASCIVHEIYGDNLKNNISSVFINAKLTYHAHSILRKQEIIVVCREGLSAVAILLFPVQFFFFNRISSTGGKGGERVLFLKCERILGHVVRIMPIS